MSSNTHPACDRPATPAISGTQSGVRLAGTLVRHLHWFRYAGDDAFSASSLYRCRCGVVKHGL